MPQMLPKLRTSLKLLCLALFVTLASCVESERPLSDPAASRFEPRLCGVWERSVTDENGDSHTEFLHVGRAGKNPIDPARKDPEPGLMRFLLVFHVGKSRELDDPMDGRFFCSTIGSETYVNWVIPADPASAKPARFWFLKYRLEGDQLSVWDQDPKATAAAIESGKLQGVVKRKSNPNALGDFDELRITDSSDNLAKFFAAGGSASCFPESGKRVYKRIR